MSSAIAFIDNAQPPEGQPDAPSYYNKFEEPVLPADATIQIGSQKLLPGMTVLGLLEAIGREAKSNQDILLVDHGTIDGPSIPLSEGNPAFLQKNVLLVLNKYEKGQLNADQIAPMLHFSKSEFLRFWELVQNIRKLRLNRVELRACNVGGSKETLTLLKGFFGSSSLCAPKEYDVFCALDPGPPGPDAISILLSRYPDAKITGNPPDRFGLAVIGALTFKAAAESERAITIWVNTHLPGPSVQVSGQFPVHGIKPSVGAEKMIWAGERKYRSLLEMV